MTQPNILFIVADQQNWNTIANRSTARTPHQNRLQLHDWSHTFIAVGGAQPLPYPDGKDLTSFFENPNATGPDHILNVYYGGEFFYTQRIAIGERYKHVFNGFDWDEFYDLAQDAGEFHNVIDDQKYFGPVNRTRDALWELMERYGDPYTRGRYGAGRYLPRHQ